MVNPSVIVMTNSGGLRRSIQALTGIDVAELPSAGLWAFFDCYCERLLSGARDVEAIQQRT
jgi:hypothetical protein